MRDWQLNATILLVGAQGTGKNKVRYPKNFASGCVFFLAKL